MANLSNKTMVELRAEFIALGDSLSTIAGVRKEYDIEIRDRVEKAAARARLLGMNKKEKDALMVAIEESP